MEKKKSLIWTNAIIIALISIIYWVVLYFTKTMSNGALSSVQYFIVIIGLVIVCIQYSKSLNGNVTFGNLFAFGFKTGAAYTLILLLWTILAFKFIFPNLTEELIQQQTAAALKKGYSQSDIDKGMEFTRKYMMLFATGGVIIVDMILSLIGSLIGAAVAKKNPQANNPFGQ
ncbi:MAG: DUF4199 family protein [Arachidicoccus sp.]|nr:DUF4199 family protein [Arachidicoccus sp.]